MNTNQTKNAQYRAKIQRPFKVVSYVKIAFGCILLDVGVFVTAPFFWMHICRQNDIFVTQL